MNAPRSPRHGALRPRGDEIANPPFMVHDIDTRQPGLRLGAVAAVGRRRQ
jgi:hypothetical protein